MGNARLCILWIHHWLLIWVTSFPRRVQKAEPQRGRDGEMKRNAREKSSRVDGNDWPAGRTTISVRSDRVTRSQSARLCTSRTQISTANGNAARPCSASPHQRSAWTDEAQGLARTICVLFRASVRTFVFSIVSCNQLSTQGARVEMMTQEESWNDAQVISSSPLLLRSKSWSVGWWCHNGVSDQGI